MITAGVARARHNVELGRQGEKLAAKFYRQRGAAVIAANVRYAAGELDLIVREPDRTIVFVEVKTRSGGSFGGAEAVGARKLARMRKAASQWLDGRPLYSVRFDVIVLTADSSEPDGFGLEHFQGVEDGSR